jgi:hypothetical protein
MVLLVNGRDTADLAALMVQRGIRDFLWHT